MRLCVLLVAVLTITLLKDVSVVTSDSSDDLQLLKQQVQDMQQQMATDKQQLQQQMATEKQQLQQQMAMVKRDMQSKLNKFEAENLELKQDVSDLSDKVRILAAGNQHLGNTVDKLENITKELKQKNLKLQNVNEASGKSQHNGTFISFSAYASENREYTGGMIVLFDTVRTNEGSLYSPETSTFTCVIPGYYMFSLSVLTHSDKYMDAEIVVDGISVAVAFGHSIDYGDQGSNTVIVLCPAPSQVFVRTITSNSWMYGHPNLGYSTFTGVLLVRA